jgi:uncharacterized membrane protein SpoIIM required for sporulation
MLDLLFNPQKAERHPIEIVLIGIFYSSLSILLGLWVFKSNSSLAIVFLTVLSCLYVVQGAMKMEERRENNWNSEKWTLKHHKPIILMILCLFIGFTISFSIWSFVLPAEISANIFSMQGSSVDQIKIITGNATNVAGSISAILANNLNIILVSLVFALFYGAGVIYILAWNASVMGLVIGTVARETFGLIALPIAFAKYFIHGIPEMLAYIVAAVAGGIVYFAFIKGDLTKKGKTKRIVIDVIVLLGISILLLLIAAILEVFVSSLI